MHLPPPLPDSPKQNHLLAALGAKSYLRLADDLELVRLRRDQIIHEPGHLSDYVYFPTTSIVSRTATTENGASTALAMSGNDGLVGVSLILGRDELNYRVAVQCPGNAYRLSSEFIRWELDQSGELLRLALRYAHFLMAQMAQSAICNRHHCLEQQLCRWLLSSQDLIAGNQIDLTQVQIAQMLGVRREGVTEAAGRLQAAGLIHYSRGHITLVDRPALEARACECYAAARSAQQRLYLPAPGTRIKSMPRANPATLRRRAEARLSKTAPGRAEEPADKLRWMHELQVRQIELEMQQEALQAAYDEADALRERYADIYDFAPTPYFTLNARGTILDLNLAGAILLGIKRSQRNRYRFNSSVSAQQLATFDRFIDEVLAKKARMRCEILLQPTLQRGGAEVRIEAVSDEIGQECRMVVIDISAEKNAERVLQDRDKYQRALLDNFPFDVWLKDEESRYLAVNAPLASRMGWSSTQALVGMTDFDISTSEQAQISRAEDRALLKSGGSTTVERCIDLDSAPRWFEIYKSALVIDGQSVGTLGLARDITLRHTAQIALADSESRQRNLIENLPLGVIISQDKLLKYVNPKWLELTGYDADEVIERCFAPLIVPADRRQVMAAHRRRMSGEPAPEKFTVRMIGKSGKVIDCLCHFSTVQWNRRNATLGIVEDVTGSPRDGSAGAGRAALKTRATRPPRLDV